MPPGPALGMVSINTVVIKDLQEVRRQKCAGDSNVEVSNELETAKCF